MVAFYKEVCIIYGAEHPLHILWLCNFISGLVAQLGERSVRIREVEGSNPFGSTISRKITANSAVIFRLTTIIPQTAENPDHFWNPQAVSSGPSPPADFRFMCLSVRQVLF